MSKTGKTVFASSFAAFLTGRVYDQIRCSVAYSESNVKLVATHAGLTLRRRWSNTPNARRYSTYEGTSKYVCIYSINRYGYKKINRKNS